MYPFGIDIVESPQLVIAIRVKRHRKKRIDKKWLKRYGYRYVPDKQAYLFKDPYGGIKLFIHPYYAHDLRMEIGMRELLNTDGTYQYKSIINHPRLNMTE